MKYQPGLFDLLVVIFVVLRLMEVIAWAWVWVLSPLWVAILLGIILGVLEVVTPYAKIDKKLFNTTWFLWTRKW